MKAKELILGACAVGAMAGNVGAVEPVKAGLSLDDPMFMDKVATCRGGPVRMRNKTGAGGRKRILCPDPPYGFMDERVAVKKTTKKIGTLPVQKAGIDLDEYAKQLAGEKLAVKHTTKKIGDGPWKNKAVQDIA